MDKTEDQRFNLQLTAHAAAKTDLHLTLHTHPIDLRSLSTGVTAQLLPTVLQDPADLSLRPHRHLARIGSGHHSAKIDPRRSHHLTVRADRRQDRDNAILGKLLTLFQHTGINNAVAGLIQQFNACLHRIAFADRICSEFNNITVVDDQRVVLWHTHRMTGLGVLHQHAVLTVNGDEELGLGESQHQLLVLLKTMAGHMNALTFAVDNLRPEHHQPVDRVDHGNRVSWNRAGGENNRVGGFNPDLGMFTTGDAAQGRKWFALATGHQQQGFAIGHIIDLLDRHKQLIRSPHVAKFTGFGDHIQHGTPQEANLATVLERQLKNHRNPMD